MLNLQLSWVVVYLHVCRMEGYDAFEDNQKLSAQGTITRTLGKKRWIPSGGYYFIRFMANQVEQRLKVDKVFKPQAIDASI